MIVLAALLAIVLLLAIVAAGAHVVAMNLADIVTNGVTFWPVFWILLVLALMLGGSRAGAGK